MNKNNNAHGVEPMVNHLMTTNEIKELLSRALVGRLGTCKDNQPYAIPMCFTYYNGKIYFHCAPKGRKIENMKANPKVCFQVDEHRLVPSTTPCDFTMHYQSVLVSGKVQFLKDPKEKLRTLKMMVDKYNTAKLAKALDKAMVHQVEVGEIVIEEITGKRMNKCVHNS